jgi:iron complex outermembrane recepter protein
MKSQRKFAAGALTTLLPLLGHAQQSPIIDEVIVTAEKKEQSVLDVGMSVNAFAGADLSAAGVARPAELNGFVPSLNVKENIPGVSPIFTIRGVGLNNFAANNNPTVGVYVDEVFLTSTAMMTFSLYDIARVEVLKGPQGTLYGRNTTAGAIGFFTRRPEQEFAADISTTYGNYERLEVEGSLNIPLSDTTAMRFSGLVVEQSEGFWEDRQGRSLGDQSVKSGRLQFAFDGGGAVSANLKIEYTDVDSEAGQFDMFGTQSLANPLAVCAPVAADRIDRSQCRDFFGNQNNDGDPYKGDWDPDPFVMEQGNITFALKADVGEMQLNSITGYQFMDRTLGTDVDGTLIRQADFVLGDDVDQLSQELRLSGSAGESMDWIVGLFYSRDNVDSVVDGNFSDLVAAFTGGAVTDERLQNLIDQRTTAWAAFAHTEWQLSDLFSLTLAARFTDEQKEFTATATDLSIRGGTGGGFFGAPDPNCGAAQVACNSISRIDDSEVSWRTALNFKPTEDLLAYFSISRGFKSGGINGGFVSRSAVLAPFEPETVLAYELGAKADLLGGSMRLTGAVFYYDYEDVQTQVQVNVGGLSVIRLGNVPKAEVQGAEIELRWLPTDRLDLGLGLSFLDTQLGAFSSPVGPVPAGNDLPNAPKNSLVSDVRYEVPIGDYSLAFNANARYSDDAFRDSLNQRLVWTEASWVYNANVELAAAAKWSLSLWGRNLSDEQVSQSAANNGIGNGFTLPQAPRTFGATFKYSFR